jgi:hypothetical protein
MYANSSGDYNLTFDNKGGSGSLTVSAKKYGFSNYLYKSVTTSGSYAYNVSISILPDYCK